MRASHVPSASRLLCFHITTCADAAVLSSLKGGNSLHDTLHVVLLPLALLPHGATTGSIVDLCCSINTAAGAARDDAVRLLQADLCSRLQQPPPPKSSERLGPPLPASTVSPLHPPSAIAPHSSGRHRPPPLGIKSWSVEEDQIAANCCSAPPQAARVAPAGGMLHGERGAASLSVAPTAAVSGANGAAPGGRCQSTHGATGERAQEPSTEQPDRSTAHSDLEHAAGYDTPQDASRESQLPAGKLDNSPESRQLRPSIGSTSERPREDELAEARRDEVQPHGIDEHAALDSKASSKASGKSGWPGQVGTPEEDLREVSVNDLASHDRAKADDDVGSVAGSIAGSVHGSFLGSISDYEPYTPFQPPTSRGGP